jgi:hypothetical protein
VSDPLTQPLDPGQLPYHLRTYAQADLEVERRHLAMLVDMHQRQKAAPTIAEIKAKEGKGYGPGEGL